ncbi:L,D-transpeptidase scaffold domain-containing protein [Mucilaginibacter gilvus]|uniref:L,D-transpeptidase n=1 Tax=Mucilaginibacter gilvus TaxID=2305909 RepID=A0A3S3UT33_9SPHI|nr:L,D-transpeptidase family protein [Mucilaginibacter gilvus]RWY53764.1 L,D-transpeptidase [Mucilaginibacter gilvus]
MKKQVNPVAYQPYRYSIKTSLLLCLFLVALMLAVLTAKASDKQVVNKTNDRELSDEIARQLNGPKLPLNYPLTVKRFYLQRQFTQNWIVKEADAGQTWAAMLMIDCVLQFGLNHVDYHPTELLYGKLHDMLEHPDRVPLVQKARFEIILTDAMLSFTNNLHFGKYNPLFPDSKIDKGGLPFDAMELLSKAMLNKDFMTIIISAQPQNKLYQNLQSYMHKIAGVQLDDCYEFPEADVRKMAINMERLRWSALDTVNFIHINVPSYKLSFYHRGAVDTFRVIVGMPGTPTPSLSSAIKYFTTTPEVRVVQKTFVKELLPKAILDPAYLANNHYAIYNNGGMLITPGKAYLKLILKAPQRYYATQTEGCDNATGQMVMSFDNIYDIYLHDTPEQDLFFTNNRAYSHGCVRVQHIVNLVKLLLVNENAQSTVTAMDKAVDKGLRKNFYLKTPMPIDITYLTCEMVNGILVVYDDIYGLDKTLDMLMYSKNDPTLKVTQN